MENLKNEVNKLVTLASKTTKRTKKVTKDLMISWIKNLVQANAIHNKNFDHYANKSVRFLSVPSYHIAKDEDKWFVEDIIRASYSHVIGDKETVREWIKELNELYDSWENDE